MTIVDVRIDRIIVPDSPYAMWLRGELDDYLHVPDSSKVEVIGGRIVVTPAPALEHASIVQDVNEIFVEARIADPAYNWKSICGSGLDLVGIRDGYIPDLKVMDRGIYQEARRAGVRFLVPDQVELVMEVTSPSNADVDRRPTQHRDQPTKWNGYAKAEIPYYLLIDRSPKTRRAILYSIPDEATGAYLHEESWEFGEVMRLPEPFGIEIPTDEWRTWED
ncbi:MAG TPA: Uma2 family endonuclease [Streptosporangiaceae bacterium]